MRPAPCRTGKQKGSVMVNFKQIEEDALNAVKKVIADAEAHEPAIEDAVVEALGAAGAPGALASAIGVALGELLTHFKNEAAAAPAAPAASDDDFPATPAAT